MFPVYRCIYRQQNFDNRGLFIYQTMYNKKSMSKIRCKTFNSEDNCYGDNTKNLVLYHCLHPRLYISLNMHLLQSHLSDFKKKLIQGNSVAYVLQEVRLDAHNKIISASRYSKGEINFTLTKPEESGVCR